MLSTDMIYLLHIMNFMSSHFIMLLHKIDDKEWEHSNRDEIRIIMIFAHFYLMLWIAVVVCSDEILRSVKHRNNLWAMIHTRWCW